MYDLKAIGIDAMSSLNDPNDLSPNVLLSASMSSRISSIMRAISNCSPASSVLPVSSITPS